MELCEVMGCCRNATTTVTDTRRRAPETRRVCSQHKHELEELIAAIPEVCIVEGCTNKAHLRGLCKKHNAEARETGKVDEIALPKRNRGRGLRFPRAEEKAAQPAKSRVRTPARKKSARRPPPEQTPTMAIPPVKVTPSRQLELFMERCMGVVVGAEEAMTALGVLMDERRLSNELLGRVAVLGRDANNLLDNFSKQEPTN